MNDVDAAVIIKDNVPNIRATDSALTNSITHQCQQKKYDFQTSAHERRKHLMCKKLPVDSPLGSDTSSSDKEEPWQHQRCISSRYIFLLISDSVMISIVESLRQLRVLALCYCLGDISISSFNLSLPNLRKLRLERVTHWMSNNDLVILTQNCVNLIELSFLGCTLLNQDSQLIISQGWPGLICIHLEV